MTPELLSPLAVVCHDAGACNVILPWLRRAGMRLRPVMGGPAARLFESFRAHPCAAAAAGTGNAINAIDASVASVASVASDEALAAALDGAAMLLSGTGWASDLEHRARRMARERGVFSAAVIDHWVNYAMRFERGGETVWPDEFWVTDEHALAIARGTFPGRVVRCFDNLYLRAEVAGVAPLPATPRVLVALEPARSDWGRGVPGEFQALDHFMRERVAAGIAADVPVRCSPHPSDRRASTTAGSPRSAGAVPMPHSTATPRSPRPSAPAPASSAANRWRWSSRWARAGACSRRCRPGHRLAGCRHEGIGRLGATGQLACA
ncbi:MAG: hypothetical protein U1F67_08105 [Rubrivivax sp.]